MRCWRSSTTSSLSSYGNLCAHTLRNLPQVRSTPSTYEYSRLGTTNSWTWKEKNKADERENIGRKYKRRGRRPSNNNLTQLLLSESVSAIHKIAILYRLFWDLFSKLTSRALSESCISSLQVLQRKEKVKKRNLGYKPGEAWSCRFQHLYASQGFYAWNHFFHLGILQRNRRKYLIFILWTAIYQSLWSLTQA